ncbi:MAG TPA: hypothetical protein VJ892_03245 [Candidatus Absconditabacterales bacterium]|nr:hypothetical protein [Candidatus Absconditabacterales bacterium]
MKKLYLLIFVFLSLFFVGCSFESDFLDIENTESLQTGILENNFDIEEDSKQILSLMEEESFAKIARFVHPVKGVRFSPYTYIDLDTSVVLYPDDFQGNLNSGELMRGYTDGAGFEIEETIYDYFKEWVYSTGFLYADQTFVNQTISRGNNLNNINDVFPGSQHIEYYFDGFDPQYEGMDRLSLTLVFEDYNGKYYLVGLIRGSWTI